MDEPQLREISPLGKRMEDPTLVIVDVIDTDIAVHCLVIRYLATR
jgi:hypothetical protein